MEEIQAPNKYKLNKFSIFLAGSIGADKPAEEWQKEVIKKLDKQDVIILNPRRDDFDRSLEQSIKNEKFREQVEWEIQGLTDCDLILFYFAPDSEAPVTLLELGLFNISKKIVVCCPDGFWRKGNVDVVCKIYSIPQVKTLDNLVEYAKIKYLEKYKSK